jgi:hypothetical protein
MKIRAAVLVAVAVASVGALLAPAEAIEITTVGTVVSTGHDSLVVKIDDHGHKIPFAVGKDTTMPSGLAPGSRVSVVYHPTGATGQAADSVTLLPGAVAKTRRARPAGPARSAPTSSKS